MSEAGTDVGGDEYGGHLGAIGGDLGYTAAGGKVVSGGAHYLPWQGRRTG